MAEWWIGQLGARCQLAGVVEDVIEELRELANRPVVDDSKERQAIDAAVIAIAKIGDPKGVDVLRGVLFSTEWYHRDDTRWGAADALGTLVSQQFVDEPDPVQSAREWLRSHPDVARGTT
jgi:HEAT repeat protein